MRKVQSQTTSNPCSISQKAAIEALTGPQDFLAPNARLFEARRDLVVSGLNACKGIDCPVPEGAFYVFPDISEFFGRTLKGVLIESASDFAMYLLEHARVATVTGDAFGAPNCIRISYAASTQELVEAINRIKAALA